MFLGYGRGDRKVYVVYGNRIYSIEECFLVGVFKYVRVGCMYVIVNMVI